MTDVDNNEWVVEEFQYIHSPNITWVWRHRGDTYQYMQWHQVYGPDDPLIEQLLENEAGDARDPEIAVDETGQTWLYYWKAFSGHSRRWYQEDKKAAVQWPDGQYSMTFPRGTPYVQS